MTASLDPPDASARTTLDAWATLFDGSVVTNWNDRRAAPPGFVHVIHDASAQTDYVRTEQGAHHGIILFRSRVEDAEDRLAGGPVHFAGIRPGDLHVFSRARNEQPHLSRWAGPLSLVSVMLRPCTVHASCRQCGVPYAPDAFGSRFFCDDPLLEALLRQLGDAVAADLGPPSAYVDQLLRTVSTHLVTHYRTPEAASISDPASERAVSADRRLPSDRLQRVTRFVDDHLEESIAVADLASEACYSEHHFSRLFRSTMGLSPYAYVIHRRMETAARMLATSDAPVAEVAASVGYDRGSHFARAFKKHFGVPPSRYPSAKNTADKHPANEHSANEHTADFGSASRG